MPSLFLMENKQYITVDNRYELLYILFINKGGTYENYNQQFINGTDL